MLGYIFVRQRDTFGPYIIEVFSFWSLWFEMLSLSFSTVSILVIVVISNDDPFLHFPQKPHLSPCSSTHLSRPNSHVRSRSCICNENGFFFFFTIILEFSTTNLLACGGVEFFCSGLLGCKLICGFFFFLFRL